MDYNNLPETRVKGKDGKWYDCKPFVTSVKGGKAVIYPSPDGTEIKREPLARYVARIRDDAMDSGGGGSGKKAAVNTVPDSDMVTWAIYCITHTAALLDSSVDDTTALLDRNGYIAYLLENYDALSEQGYEYIAGLLVGWLQAAESTQV